GVGSQSRLFTVVVREVNQLPVLADIADQTVEEGSTLALELSATDGDVPVQTLTYRLVSGPEGMAVTTAGRLTWIPTEAQAPSTNGVTVSVSDGVGSVNRSFTVVVREVNQLPVLSVIADQTLDEGVTLTLDLSAMDGDVPVQTLTYRLVSGPEGMAVTTAGRLTWTPTEAQAPSTNAVTVSVSDGVGSVNQSFEVVVREVNQLPVLVEIPDQTIDEGATLTLDLSVTDGDVPVQTLTYRLVSGPEGMAVTAAGRLTWTPTEAQAPSTNAVTVSVSDGVGSADRTFTVVVRQISKPINVAGLAIDGYIAGGIVWFDANLNGLLDPGEPRSTTDRQGRFQLGLDARFYDRNQNGRLDLEEGRIVVEGGVDLATGQTLRGQLRAPPGSAVVTPLTSVVDSVARASAGLSVTEAEASVQRAFGLPSVPLTSFDPFDSASRGDPRGVAIQSVAAQVADTVSQISAFLVGGGASVPPAQVAAAVTEFFAAKVASGQEIDLAQPATVLAALTESATEVGAGVPQAAAVLVAQAVSEQNAIKGEAVAVSDPVEAIRRIAQVQAVAQQEAIQAIERIAVNPVGLDAFAVAFTGESLEGAVDKAPIGDITGGSTAPGKFSFQDSEMVISESGETPVPITVLRKEGSSGVVLIDVVFSPSVGLQTNRVRLRFADGEIRKTVEPGLILVNDGVSEPEVRYMVSLNLVDGSPTRPGFGSPAKGSVTVMDDDSPGEIGFGASRYRILEGGWGSAPIVLERRGGTAGRVVVRVGLASSTAVLGSDFSENRVTVVFESGERIRIVPLPLVDDVQPEALEELSLTLSLDPESAPDARLVDGATSAEVLVEDDDTPPRLELHPGAAGGPRLLCVGPVGLEFVLETSTDLRSWKRMPGGRVTTEGFTSPIVLPLDGTIPGVAFYRLVLP
ncbi:MAG: hypothetical protein RLZ45_2920, partial [Verrucomicrobiota bacterium]